MSSETGIYDEAEFYDLVMGGAAAADSAELRFYASQINSTAGPSLELACGSGRLTIPLARSGAAITGLDVAPAMRRRARLKAVDAAVEVPFVQGDMRDFNLNERFDTILLACNSMLHLHARTEYEGLLASVRRHLLPGGKFLVSFFSPAAAVMGREPNQRFEFMPPCVDPATARASR